MPKSHDKTKSKEDEQTLAELNSGHRRSKAICQLVQSNYLTNRFHVAGRLFSNRSEMASKCGKNKKAAHEAIAECVTDVLTKF